MTKRAPVSTQQNIWFNAQQVDDTDLTLEQYYNNTVTGSIISNHIGTGVLSEVLVQNVLFDSAVASGFLDGVIITTQNQPVDNNFGNQLELSLTNSQVAGKKTVKVCIIGLDFQSNLQYEIFYFKTNEIQVSHKHFTKILLILFNDFIGNPDLSLNLNGHLVIKEAVPFSISRHALMASQDVEPNLFFRDFFVDGFTSLTHLLQTALPLYNIDSLNITTEPLDNKVLAKDDVTTQIGQKFIAQTNNIQKLTLLLSVQNLDAGNEDDLAWNGDLVISVYPLQSNIECSSDIAPNLPIDFPPANTPLAQVSVNYNTLQDQGIVLDSVPQPVDFIFSNSPIASGNILVVGNYYAFSAKRSGSANKCDILIAAGADHILDSRITTFTGNLWVDMPEQDLWFKIWTDAAKVSDGQAYESGHGIVLNKTTQDPDTLSTIDYSLQNIQFFGNEVFHAVLSAGTEKSTPVPDPRTGDPVLSRQQFIPKINLLNTLDLVNLQQASEPLILGAIADKNRKFFDAISASISSKLYSSTIIHDELIIRIVEDSTDTGRYDTSVNGLITNVLNGDFIGAKIVPNASNPSVYYRIASSKIASCILGDVNGDGIIDTTDLTILNSYVDYDLNVGLPEDTVVTSDSITTTYINGYTTVTVPFSNLFGVSFQLVDPVTNTVVASGTDGVLVADPIDPRIAQFTSASVTFNSIIGISSYKLVMLTPATLSNYGGFDIIALNSSSDVLTVRKIYLTGDVIMEMLRADVDSDFHITYNDGYLLQNYIERTPLLTSFNSTFPAPATNPFTKIGTRFNVIRLKLEKFIDREDDYSFLGNGRPGVVHTAPDIFLNDGYFAQHNFYDSPVDFNVYKQLTWEESLIVTNSQPKLVPSVFTQSTGFVENSCSIEGVKVNVYESKPVFDPGLVDVFVPNNLIIGNGGEIFRPDGYFYKVDFEVGTIILEIPDGLFGSERTINILDDFIADYTGDGRTRLGFPSMRFADCSYVTNEALQKDQLRFSISIQSFSPNTNGLSVEGYEGAIVDGKMGVSVDYKTGLLTLNFTNLFQDPILKTLTTKVQVHVFLKQGGFNNQPLFVDSTKMSNMLQLISVFSGANDGGASALVDLAGDVTGVLPIIHGGTGLNDVGTFGTVLTSNGSGLSYQFIADLGGVVPFSTGIPDANKIPKTDGYGLLDPSFYYKNPIFIYGVAGTQSHDNVSPSVIGAFTFRFDSYILQGLKDIKLEAILETTNIANIAGIQLFNVNGNFYIPLNGVSEFITTANTSATLVVSDDLKNQLSEGAVDYIYEIHLSLNPSSAIETAICKMARLVMTYNHPEIPIPPVSHSSNFVPYLPSPDPE